MIKWIVNKEKQAILTPAIGSILTTLMNAQEAGAKIYSVCNHYSSNKELMGYIVIVDEHYRVEE